MKKLTLNIFIAPPKNIIFWLLKLNFSFSKLIRKDLIFEEQIILAVFLFVFQITLIFSSILYFLRIETLYKLDTKLVSLIFFITFSFVLLKLVFRKNLYKKVIIAEQVKIKVIFQFFLVNLLTLLLLGIAILYEFFKGNLSEIFNILTK